ncbi:hypothetical protein FB107DRAFT_274079 [Schizophyllum commune]
MEHTQPSHGSNHKQHTFVNQQFNFDTPTSSQQWSGQLPNILSDGERFRVELDRIGAEVYSPWDLPEVPDGQRTRHPPQLQELRDYPRFPLQQQQSSRKHQAQYNTHANPNIPLHSHHTPSPYRNGSTAAGAHPEPHARLNNFESPSGMPPHLRGSPAQSPPLTPSTVYYSTPSASQASTPHAPMSSSQAYTGYVDISADDRRARAASAASMPPLSQHAPEPSPAPLSPALAAASAPVVVKDKENKQAPKGKGKAKEKVEGGSKRKRTSGAAKAKMEEELDLTDDQKLKAALKTDADHAKVTEADRIKLFEYVCTPERYSLWRNGKQFSLCEKLLAPGGELAGRKLSPKQLVTAFDYEFKKYKNIRDLEKHTGGGPDEEDEEALDGLLSSLPPRPENARRRYEAVKGENATHTEQTLRIFENSVMFKLLESVAGNDPSVARQHNINSKSSTAIVINDSDDDDDDEAAARKASGRDKAKRVKREANAGPPPGTDVLRDIVVSVDASRKTQVRIAQASHELAVSREEREAKSMAEQQRLAVLQNEREQELHRIRLQQDTLSVKLKEEELQQAKQRAIRDDMATAARLLESPDELVQATGKALMRKALEQMGS